MAEFKITKVLLEQIPESKILFALSNYFGYVEFIEEETNFRIYKISGNIPGDIKNIMVHFKNVNNKIEVDKWEEIKN